MKQNRWSRFFFCGVLFFIMACFLQLAARCADGFATWYVTAVYPLFVNTLGRFFGFFPFSMVELLLYLLLIFLVCGLWHLRREKKRYLAAVFCLASVLFFSYTVCCGINYFGRPFSETLPYSVQERSKEELSELLVWLTEQVNESCEEYYEIESAYSCGELGRLGTEAMENLAKEYPALCGFYPQPKPLLVSWILSVQQLAGIYSPFTVEANYNQEMTLYNIPHTICHELSHLRGFMREDEANFIGFLACIGSENALYRYSGYVSGWIYAGNALAKVDREAYRLCYEKLGERVKQDLQENREFWNRYDSKVAKAAETMNDTYLKANRQEDGVQSYGRAVDLMLAWYLKSVVFFEHG